MNAGYRFPGCGLGLKRSGQLQFRRCKFRKAENGPGVSETSKLIRRYVLASNGVNYRSASAWKRHSLLCLSGVWDEARPGGDNKTDGQPARGVHREWPHGITLRWKLPPGDTEVTIAHSCVVGFLHASYKKTVGLEGDLAPDAGATVKFMS